MKNKSPVHSAVRLVLITLYLGFPPVSMDILAQGEADLSRWEMFEKYISFPSLIQGGILDANWLSDGSRFWYREQTSGHDDFFLVDPRDNSVEPFFDRDRLIDALETIFGKVKPETIQFETFGFDEAENTISFEIEGEKILLDLNNYKLKKTKEPVSNLLMELPVEGEVLTSDKLLAARVVDHNLWIRKPDEKAGTQVTSDGKADQEWIVRPDSWVKGFWTGTGALWSNDGKKLALKKIDGRKVEHIQFVRFMEPGAPMGWTRFPRPGDPIFQTELYILDEPSRELIRLNANTEPDQRLELIAWSNDHHEVFFLRLNRKHTQLDLVAADVSTGMTRILVTESAETYVVGAGHGFEKDRFMLLPGGTHFIWKSARDGWDHFYLHDANGKLIRRLTTGEFPAREIIAVAGEWFYFTAPSKDRPYDLYLYRVRLDGTSQVQLTRDPGVHHIEFSPSKQFFLDTHSSITRSPQVDLGKSDGQLIRTISKANIDQLDDSWWLLPEEFVVKALDQQTDLHGVIFKPYDFDPGKKYPVVQYLGGDGRSFFNPFTAQRVLRAIAQMGFIVLVADGPGMEGRGMKYRDAGYMRRGQFEIPENTNIIKQLGQLYPFLDLSRVGLIGHSWGGYLTLRAMLTDPDNYQVGIAMAPDVDFHHDLHFYFEPEMGLPNENPLGYLKASNLSLAGNLEGKLMLVVGTEDYGSFPGTMKMIGELVKNDKQHDMLIMPGQPHDFSGSSASYSLKATVNYLIEHLKH